MYYFFSIIHSIKQYLFTLFLLSILQVAVTAQHWGKNATIGSDGVLEVGKYIDFHQSTNGTADYEPRIWAAGNSLEIGGALKVHGNLLSQNSMLASDPTRTWNWNTIWQTGFFESEQVTSAPENVGWFWGINMGHSGNKTDILYGGQILIKNLPLTPTMYFRSKDSNGNGTWAKVLHDQGAQKINGKLQANEIIVKIDEGRDYVFYPNYDLPKLEEVEKFVKEKHHLPEIPSEKEMLENGITLGQMNILLLQKVEELTLYTIQQQKEINQLLNENKQIKGEKRELEQFNKKLSEIEKRILELEKIN